MSVEAYKVLKVETAERPSFNIEEDWELLRDYIDDDCPSPFLAMDTSQIQDDLQDEDFTAAHSERELAILRHIAADDTSGAGFVEYYCY